MPIMSVLSTGSTLSPNLASLALRKELLAVCGSAMRAPTTGRAAKGKTKTRHAAMKVTNARTMMAVA